LEAFELTSARRMSFHGAMRLRVVAALSIVVALVACSGCKSRVTKAECARIVEHFIDLKLKEDPPYATLSPALKATVRAEVKKEAESDPDVQQAENRCEDEITRAEFQCASKAKTAAEWNACIN
jgi:hypothetical protein